MNPTTRYILRTSFVFLVTAAASLQAALPGISYDDALAAAIAGILAAGTYAGIGAATPLEPRIGKKA